jgi:hypothetical protein
MQIAVSFARDGSRRHPDQSLSRCHFLASPQFPCRIHTASGDGLRSAPKDQVTACIHAEAKRADYVSRARVADRVAGRSRGKQPQASGVRSPSGGLAPLEGVSCRRCPRQHSGWPSTVGRVPTMAKEHAPRRRRVPAVVAVVQPAVAKRLARMESILIEMRHEQDIKLKRIGAIERRLDELTYHVEAIADGRRSTRRKT